MIYIACDHQGYQTKLKVLKFLTKNGVEFEDLGTNSTDSVDYPDFAKKVGTNVLEHKDTMGILICMTGIGMSMAVNRFKGIRGALCHTVKDAYCARFHNDANVLVLSARDCGSKHKKIINTFLNTQFEGGRHIRRIEKMDKLG